MPTPECLIAIWHLGGAVARVPDRATAFGRRSAPYLLSFDSCWTDPAQSERVTAWTRQQVEAMTAHSPGGSYLNFPGVGAADPDVVKAAYGQNYDALARIKARYDPANMFRLNQNIPPAEAGALAEA
jgi:FAD/FMN-containing dehydrogenase